MLLDLLPLFQDEEIVDPVIGADIHHNHGLPKHQHRKRRPHEDDEALVLLLSF